MWSDDALVFPDLFDAIMDTEYESSILLEFTGTGAAAQLTCGKGYMGIVTEGELPSVNSYWSRSEAHISNLFMDVSPIDACVTNPEQHKWGDLFLTLCQLICIHAGVDSLTLDDMSFFPGTDPPILLAGALMLIRGETYYERRGFKFVHGIDPDIRESYRALGDKVVGPSLLESIIKKMCSGRPVEWQQGDPVTVREVITKIMQPGMSQEAIALVQHWMKAAPEIPSNMMWDVRDRTDALQRIDVSMIRTDHRAYQ